MSKKIDTIGVYRGEVFETALQINKSGNPMFVINVRADERYIDDANDLEFYLEQKIITEAVPQWINWSEYDETAKSFLTLYNRKSENEFFVADKNDPGYNASLNYEQVQKAFGWDGGSFDDLQGETYKGTKILFRVKEEPDEKYGPTTVGSIDSFDANPTRELKSVDQDVVLGLNKLVKGIKKKNPSKPAAGPKPKVTKPKATPKPKVAPVTTAAAAPTVTEAPAAPVPTTSTPVVEFTKEEAWADVFKQIGDTEDVTAIQDAWISTVAEVSEMHMIKEEGFTPAHWTQVHKFVLRDFSVAV